MADKHEERFVMQVGEGRFSPAGRPAAITDFFAAFGMDDDDADAGKVFTDRTGWPLALSRAWFKGADGKLRFPRGRPVDLDLAGATIAQPDEIRIVWSEDAVGDPVITRRYIARIGLTDIVVDVGRAGWTFTTSRDAGFDLAALRIGERAWPRS